MAYPPEPWHLRGQMYVSVFLVPHRLLPPLPAALRAAVHPLLIAGRAVVGTAWVRYEPGGTLHYRELLSSVLVLDRGRPRVSITEIWVDSAASRDGGRALWGIPKDLAELAVDPVVAGAVRVSAAAGRSIAAGVVRRGWTLPGRPPFAFSVVQALGTTVHRTRVRGRAGLGRGAAGWRADPAGPLGYLAGRRPLLTLAVTDFALTFGTQLCGERNKDRSDRSRRDGVAGG
jgi:hypothetical protein